MSNIFKVGQMVVALNNPPSNKSQYRVKGQVYEVKAIRYCNGCGKQNINIGQTSDGILGTRCSCGNLSNPTGLYWTKSIHFAPIEALESEVEALDSILESMGIDISEKVLE